MINYFLSFLLLFIPPQKEQKKYKAPRWMFHLYGNVFIERIPVLNQHYLNFLLRAESGYDSTISHKIRAILKESNYECDNYCCYKIKINKSNILRLCDSSYYKFIEPPEHELYDWVGGEDGVGYRYYFRHPQTQYAPVVKIGYEQAMEYCRFREDDYLIESTCESKSEKERRKYWKNIHCRLPKEEEMKMAMQKFKDKILYFRPTPWRYRSYLLDKANKKFVVPSYVIAEMLEEKGKAIGLTYIDSVGSFPVDHIRTYSKAEDWLGFRCVCEMEGWEESPKKD
ncbi:MAG TPA: SUMF1/EgtB/PvdO family nonheme iron enzyme [Chitinophagaceae bacterium]|nr:SUMF1/EgtB/PvdO family nonheme iron enzyme [Chitinophagaceae bacterium]